MLNYRYPLPHLPPCPLPPTKYKQYEADFPPIWRLRWKTQQVWCVTTVSRSDMEQLRVAYQKKNITHYRTFVSRMFRALFKPILRAISYEFVFHLLYASSTFLSLGARTNQSDVFPSLCNVLLGQEMFTYFFWPKATFTKPIQWRFSVFLLSLRTLLTTYNGIILKPVTHFPTSKQIIGCVPELR